MDGDLCADGRVDSRNLLISTLTVEQSTCIGVRTVYKSHLLLTIGLSLLINVEPLSLPYSSVCFPMSFRSISYRCTTMTSVYYSKLSPIRYNFSRPFHRWPRNIMLDLTSSSSGLALPLTPLTRFLNKHQARTKRL